MKINLNDLINKIEKEDYIQDLEEVKYADISKSKAKLKEYATKMIKEAVAAIKHDSLIQTQLVVNGQRPVTFALEANIINLPYSNYKKISNFFETGPEYNVNIYFETRSEYINVTGFRIDKLATEKELLANADELIDKLATLIAEKMKIVREYEKPVPHKKVNKIAGKKTTKKK